MTTDLQCYGASKIVQNNRLIEAFHGMTLMEKRLFLFCSSLVRLENLTEGDVLLVRADEFAQEFDVSTHTAYEGLQDAVENLFKRYFTYIDAKGNTVKCRWVYRLKYKKNEGEIEVSFPAEVIFMLSVFNRENTFTVYERKNIQKMTSVYAIRFYELFMQYKNIGHRTMSVQEIKEMFNISEKYKLISNLKCKVIDIAIDQINKNSDYFVSYTAIKKGRIIYAFKFTFSLKNEDQKTKTLASVEKLLQDDDWVSQRAKVGETWPEARKRLKKALLSDV